MDPGTILAIIQISASVFKLGREISLQFFGPDKAPERLKHLNSRLRILNDLLQQITVQKGSPDKLSTTRFPGSDSIENTLRDCGDFLRHYKALILEQGSFAQQVKLIAGPDASRIDEFHRKIDQHYAELGQWRMVLLHDRVDEILARVNNLRGQETGLGIIPYTVPPPYHPPSTSAPATPDINITPIPGDLSTSPIRIPPRPRPQSQQLNTIPESQFGENEIGSPNGSTHRPSHDSGRPPTVLSPSCPPSPGHYVTLCMGAKEPLVFSLDAYSVYEEEGIRIIEWACPQLRVRHFLPPGNRRIPYTKPNHTKIEVTFLPHQGSDSEHQCETITSNETRTTRTKIRYQFIHKTDRERFQRDIRVREYLEMVQVFKIHTSKARDVAVDVHIKVWARHNHDMGPTISFAYLGKYGQSYHCEYKIRWFRKELEKKDGSGGKDHKRLILYFYSGDTDLSYGPATDDSNKKGEALTTKIKRRMSIGSTSSSVSRSPPIGHPATLYDWKSETPPDDVKKIGHLDIEFRKEALRDKFINACYYAHPASSGRPTSMSDTESLGANAASLFSVGSPTGTHLTTPQRSISELEGVYPAAELSSAPRYMDPIELPSPDIPASRPIQFNNPYPFLMPPAARQNTYELEDSEPPPNWSSPAQRG
ncbi:hypothetical protein F4777DRAFT_532080 [Nemania sp. FL0916]|nr:hypothetical protein F4777DRAFT_532080 [Nemania sp. FL0916]